MANIHVLRPGFYTTLQDTGRHGVAQYGVPQSGVMDSFSAEKANLLLNNDPNAAVLEILMTGPVLEFSSETYIAVCGAQFDILLNDQAISLAKRYRVQKGDVLKFGRLHKGLRAYLAVSGGFQTESVLGSRSQYSGITTAAKLEKGMSLAITDEVSTTKALSRVNFEDTQLWDPAIEAYPGPEFALLSTEEQQQLFERSFILSSKSNRMAIPFEEPLDNTLKGITTGPVLPGTVQLTPNGTLIALMRDCQVSGGYPRVLQLSTFGICQLAQKRPGESISFKRKALDTGAISR